MSKNGASHAYDFKPHAVTSVGTTGYTYDANGNMISRGTQNITWDVENRPTAVGTATFVYDGDGNRVKKTEGGQTTIYVGKYYEKNLSTGTVTTYYYLGERLVALRNGSNLRYVHLDHLGGTSVVTNSSGAEYGRIRYYPYGSLDTDKKFTGQRLDSTGLYYYGARYYDPGIGRFISADSIAPNPVNPQSLNRYSYALNNPLKYIDPTGHDSIMVPSPDIPGTYIPLQYDPNNTAIVPGVVTPWYGGSIVWGQGGMAEYVPSGITGNIPTGGSMADVVARAGSPTPMPTADSNLAFGKVVVGAIVIVAAHVPAAVFGFIAVTDPDPITKTLAIKAFIWYEDTIGLAVTVFGIDMIKQGLTGEHIWE